MAEEVIKPQSPIKSGSVGILPLTSYDQIIMADGTRWNGVTVPEGALDPANIPIIDTTGAESDTLVPVNAQQFDGMTYKQIIDLEHGIGSFYFTLNAADDPNTKWNWMTWELVTDKFLLGAGASYEAGVEGGEETHTLTEAELPVLSGSVNFNRGNSRGILAERSGVFTVSQTTTNEGVPEAGASNQSGNYRTLNFSAGGGQAHNNMPPYLPVFMWTRIS